MYNLMDYKFIEDHSQKLYGSFKLAFAETFRHVILSGCWINVRIYIELGN
jgi:hypothetical protein